MCEKCVILSIFPPIIFLIFKVTFTFKWPNIGNHIFVCERKLWNPICNLFHNLSVNFLMKKIPTIVIINDLITKHHTKDHLIKNLNKGHFQSKILGFSILINLSLVSSHTLIIKISKSCTYPSLAKGIFKKWKKIVIFFLL